MNKQRIHWLDVAKGLMIVGMVLNHVPNYSARVGNNLDLFPWHLFGGFYGVFTMQAFFILTGMTSNFYDNWKTFIKKQIKSLILPYISFTLLTKLIGILFFQEGLFYEVGGESYFFLVESYWFLTALFVSKLMIYFTLKICKKDYQAWLIVFSIMFIGFFITYYYRDMPEPSHYKNFFHYRNGLCMTPFVYIGIWLNKAQISKKIMLICSCIYVCLYCVTTVGGYVGYDIQYISPPSYTHNLILETGTNILGLIPSFLVYCILGTILIIYLSKIINQSKLLELFGRHTLSIYCIHFVVMQLVIQETSRYLVPITSFTSFLFFFIVSILTLGMSILISIVLEHKPLSFLLGKF